jgi:hypothetical protein
MESKQNQIFHNKEDDIFYFNCPHCSLLCEVPRSEIRCTIFRHANFKDGMKFVPPHADKKTCDEWVEKDLVYGCGKPFRFDGRVLEKIGYI